MVLLLQEQRVLFKANIFVLFVMKDIIKLVTNAPNVDLLVVPGQENQFIVLHHLIVYVIKMIALVPTVLLLQEQNVL